MAESAEDFVKVGLALLCCLFVKFKKYQQLGGGAITGGFAPLPSALLVV